MKTAYLIPLTAVLGLGALAMVSSTASGPSLPDPTDMPKQVETGQVNWLRNLDEAKQLSASADKPILLLFQEIPG